LFLLLQPTFSTRSVLFARLDKRFIRSLIRCKQTLPYTLQQWPRSLLRLEPLFPRRCTSTRHLTIRRSTRQDGPIIPRPPTIQIGESTKSKHPRPLLQPNEESPRHLHLLILRLSPHRHHNARQQPPSRFLPPLRLGFPASQSKDPGLLRRIDDSLLL
jgi:hypothetical protein